MGYPLRMPLPPRLDRIWLWAIGISFLLMAPTWVVMWYEREPYLGLIQGAVIAWLLWRWIAVPALKP